MLTNSLRFPSFGVSTIADKKLLTGAGTPAGRTLFRSSRDAKKARVHGGPTFRSGGPWGLPFHLGAVFESATSHGRGYGDPCIIRNMSFEEEGSGVGAGERRFEGIGGLKREERRTEQRGVIGVRGEKEEGEDEASSVLASVVSKMMEMLDLEKQFSFYGAYHSNRWNILIHIFFVWPIFYTSLILWAYTPAFAPLPLAPGTLPLQQYMVLNWSFVQTAFYALYYVALDKKAGFLGALICVGCWISANAVAQALPWSMSWKIVLASQLICWISQIFGHQKFEGRAPALLDNLPQAFLMAPFFVLLECLQTAGYEPYPGFHKKVQKNVDDSIREFRASIDKKAA